MMGMLHLTLVAFLISAYTLRSLKQFGERSVGKAPWCSKGVRIPVALLCSLLDILENCDPPYPLAMD